MRFRLVELDACQAIQPVAVGHAYVQHHEIWPVLENGLMCGRAGRGLGDNLNIRSINQRFQSRANDLMIVRDD
jgi:hypothetical protein